MSLYDCKMCWESPCRCGYHYKNHPEYSNPREMSNFIVDILGYRSKEELEIILQLLNEKIPTKIASISEEEIKRK